MDRGYIPVLGVEAHIQLQLENKLFCGCSAAFGAPANSHTCGICLGRERGLLRANPQAIDHAIRLGMALGSNIQTELSFDRKFYTSPDLPKGYQITQRSRPILEGGFLPLENGSIEILEAHLEEDAAKTKHRPEGMELDFNRSGQALVELVSAPGLHSGREAAQFGRRLRALVLFLGICDGRMEEGSLRMDVNLSLAHGDGRPATPRIELKNLNSFSAIEAAVEYEIGRLEMALEQGEALYAQTRGWEERQRRTVLLRRKEGAEEYGYAPEPDAPVLDIGHRLEALSGMELRLPWDLQADLVRREGLTEAQAEQICQHPRLFGIWERGRREGAESATLASWLLRECLALGDLVVWQGQGLAKVCGLEAQGRITREGGAGLLAMLAKQPDLDVEEAVSVLGLENVRDGQQWQGAIEAAVAGHPQALEDIRKGKDKARGFLLGQALRTLGGRADARALGRALEAYLAERGL